MLKKESYHIAKQGMYDIEELVKSWTVGGWRGFCDVIHVPVHKIGWDYDEWFGGKKSQSIEDKIINGIMDIMQSDRWIANGFVEATRDLTDEAVKKLPIELYILAIANTAYDKPFNSPKSFPKRKKEKRDCINKILSSFIDSSTMMEAILKLTSEKTLISGFKKTSFEVPVEQMVEYEKTRKITKKLKKSLEWLSHGLAGDEAYMESWWNCVWLEIESDIKRLLDINQKIKNDIPVNDEEVDFVNQLIDFVKLRACRVVHEDKKIEYTMIAEQVAELLRIETGSVRRFYEILIPPAFIIVQNLQDSFRYYGPRYVVECRSPSCGKKFYSARENALACPNKNGRGMSACLKEWTSYKRWLEKTGRSAEEWDNEEYKDAHRKFYTPYYTGK